MFQPNGHPAQSEFSTATIAHSLPRHLSGEAMYKAILHATIPRQIRGPGHRSHHLATLGGEAINTAVIGCDASPRATNGPVNPGTDPVARCMSSSESLQ
jgi:hypothetical protein